MYFGKTIIYRYLDAIAYRPSSSRPTKTRPMTAHYAKVIMLYLTGLDNQSQSCQNFYKDGLTLSFTKILTDDAVNGWKYDIQVGITLCPKYRYLNMLYFTSMGFYS